MGLVYILLSVSEFCSKYFVAQPDLVCYFCKHLHGRALDLVRFEEETPGHTGLGPVRVGNINQNGSQFPGTDKRSVCETQSRLPQPWGYYNVVWETCRETSAPRSALR